ncbi:MAG: HD domain-containing protein [Candidatus Kapaibacterium sp.]
MEIKAKTIAAIDCGTNSFHLVVASANNRGILTPITRVKEMVRMGSSSRDMKYLLPDAMDRGAEALSKFAKISRSENAEIHAVATSAIREANNSDDFLRRVKNETGIDIHVISGAEEGRLIYIGAIHALPVYDKKTFIIDIGGGSTETIIGSRGETKYIASVKLGAIRLTRHFFNTDKTTPKQIADCMEYIRGEWAPIMRKLKTEGFEIAVGTAGTIQTLTEMALIRKGRAVPEIFNGVAVTADELLAVIDDIKSAETIKKRSNLPGMDSKRADIILAGSLILEQAIPELGINRILYSAYALREGIVFDRIRKDRIIREFRHLSHLRYQTVASLCVRYKIDLNHTEHVKKLSISIFDDLERIHRLNSAERELLEASALLHDVGYYISHDKHHKHSYYIIKNSIMPGFTNDEAELIANIARYHRKSHPKKKHENFSKLNDHKQEIVRTLAGILRIAEGIDRRQQQNVSSVETSIIDGKIKIKMIPEPTGAFPDIEKWGADRRKPLLEETLGYDINFEIAAIE